MKRILLLLLLLQSIILGAFAQSNNDSTYVKSGLSGSIHAGYDVLPFYKNNTPHIDYKGGIAAGANINYYWNWIGLGGDFDFIKNKPESIYPASSIPSTSSLTEKGITRMFYGLGPSFKHQKNEKFTTELLLRGGLSSVKGGLTDLSGITPPSLLNFHAGYDAKNVFAGKAQAQFTYYLNDIFGLNAGAYYMHHFKTRESVGSYGFSAAYAGTGEQATFHKRLDPCNCGISSIGVFAGISARIPRKPAKKVKEECKDCDIYALTITARDKFTKEILPNTDVILKNIENQIVYTGTTNNFGVVVFNNIVPDHYAIEGKLYDIKLDAATTTKSEFKPNQTLQKEILYSDNRFILKGIVVECNSTTPLQGASVILSNTALAEQKTTKTDDQGSFIFHALQNATYDIYGRKNDYFSQTEKITTKDFDRNNTLFIKLEVCMEKTDCGKAIVLKDILYDLDKYFIREDAKPELNKVAQFMKDNPLVKVELSSHTDSRASHSYNLTLSQNRANAAVNYLVQQGIDKSRLIPKGYGETKLLNRCADGVDCSEAEHQINRRTEIKVVCPD